MISHEIIGDDMQAVVISMSAGDEVRAEAGAMTYMTDGIDMDARMEGGLLGGLKRKFLAGESLFLTFFRSSRDAFLCAAGHIDINIELTKRLGAGFFGGEGFIPQRPSRGSEARLR